MFRRLRFFAALSLILGSACLAAEVPAESIAKKGPLLFSDDFERTELGQGWRTVIPAFTVINGALKGTQTRPDHASVADAKVPTRDSVLELKFRFEGASNIYAEWDDLAFKGSHAGHICRVIVTPKQITLRDDKEGPMRNDIYEMRKDPARVAEGDKLIEGRSVNFPVQLEQAHWYRLTLETVGNAMRVLVDDKPIGFLRSPGIAHETKSDLQLGVSGKDGLIDEVRIWEATPSGK